MKIIMETVSRDLERSQAHARAKIALHHFYGFTGGSSTIDRLLAGLAERKIIVRRAG